MCHFWRNVQFSDEFAIFGGKCHFWRNVPFLEEFAIFGWMCHFQGHTLRLSGTLLFSGIPMMISQKFLCICLFWKAIKKFGKLECEESYSNDLTGFFCAWFFQKNQVLKNVSINLEAKRMDGFSWKKNSIISVFTLFVAA